MAKAAKLHEIAIDQLIPYERNAKTHSPEQVEKIAASIREFGFVSPVLIDEQNRIIAGHGRVLAAKELGLKKIPAVYVEGLSDAQRRAYILADNRLTELGGWDQELINLELGELKDEDFDIDLTGFDLDLGESSDWFETREKWDDSRQEGNDEYNEFVEKFEAKKTTDDCYTPDSIYRAVSDFVQTEYGLDPEKFVRPFYPGGDYQNETYKKGDVVVDNPPFSILTEILRFYCERGVRFFLFAPTLTLFGSGVGLNITYIPTKVQVLYENGARVNTSFITNLDSCRIRSAPRLGEALEAANKENTGTNALPKYEYPPEVVTATRAGRWTENGIEIRIEADECVRVAALDAQKEQDKAIFGGGYLISAEAAKRAAQADAEADEAVNRRAVERYQAAIDQPVNVSDGAVIWPLSEREKEIVAQLKGGIDG